MTTLRCGKHQCHFDTDRYKSCPMCDLTALCPDPEGSVSGLLDALEGLYRRRWSTAAEVYVEQLSEIAKRSQELRLMVEALNQEIDWPERQRPRTSVVSHNEQRLG